MTLEANCADWLVKVAAARANPRPVSESITLAIPTLGRPILAKCLSAILDGSTWPNAVIVVDQGPSAEISGWLKDMKELGIDARHEECSGRGRALGLNVGLRLVATPFVVITDDDCEPDARWIEKYAQHLTSRPGTVFTGAVAAAGTERVLNTATSQTSSVSYRPRVTYDRFSGGNCGMSIDILRRVGLFDEDPCTRYAEDGEWAYRALRAGVPIAYAPDLVVAHIGWRDLDGRLLQYRGYALSQAAFFGKHLRRGDMFMLLRTSVHFARSLRRWLRGAIERDAELAANGRSFTLQLLPGIVAGMTSRVRAPALK